MQKSNSKKLTALFILGMVLFLILAAAILFLVFSKLKTERELSSASTEISIRAFAEAERRNIEKSESDAQTQEQNTRTVLMKSMIENDKKELLMLVNSSNPLPEGYEARLVDIGDDKQFDERGASALASMIKDCKASYDRAPVPISAYRTQEYQEMLFQDKMERLLQTGTVSLEDVYSEAAREVAVPGTSEHQTGFAVDIIDEFYTELDTYQMYTNTQRWLMANCYKYGFILRYPEDSSKITGIVFEPWHYRYVGINAAKEITDRGVTLEEYLKSLE